MSGEIFISYRREDSAGTTGRLYDRLTKSFSPKKLFMDVDAHMYGLDFVKVLDGKVSSCDLLLAVIGPGWLTAAETSGRRRLDSPEDFVRIEVASALRRDIPVIPVLVDGAAMPEVAMLPEDLKPLARRHAIELRNTRFNTDSDLVVAAIRARLRSGTSGPPRTMVAAAAAILFVVLGVTVYLVGAPTPQTVLPEAEQKTKEEAPKPDERWVQSKEKPVRMVRPVTVGREIAVQLRAGETFRDCPTVCPAMVVVPAGTFRMGSEDGNETERPLHEVTIAQPLAVGKVEVTFAEWDACVLEGGCKHKPSDEGWGRDTRPVINVSWDHVTKEYLPWLSRKTGMRYRLLSEAEWEYSARAGSRTKYAWGDEVGGDRANCDGCGSQSPKQTAPVGSFSPNAFGLHDTHGNVWELVQDCWNSNYQGAPANGSVWTNGDCRRHVIRGGSWFASPRFMRSSSRDSDPSAYRNSNVGFRVARPL